MTGSKGRKEAAPRAGTKHKQTPGGVLLAGSSTRGRSGIDPRPRAISLLLSARLATGSNATLEDKDTWRLTAYGLRLSVIPRKPPSFGIALNTLLRIPNTNTTPTKQLSLTSSTRNDFSLNEHKLYFMEISLR